MNLLNKFTQIRLARTYKRSEIDVPVFAVSNQLQTSDLLAYSSVAIWAQALLCQGGVDSRQIGSRLFAPCVLLSRDQLSWAEPK